MKIKLVLSTLLAAALTACGGGGAASSSPVVHGMAHPEVVTVLFVGDSTLTPVYSGERSTPDYVADLTGAGVTSIAVPGSTSCQADLAAIRGARASVVLINYAINDANAMDSDYYEACMRAVWRAAVDAGSVPVFVESSPLIDGVVTPNGHVLNNTRRVQMESAKRGLAAELGVMYCRLPVLPWSRDLIPDGIHPGYKAKPLIGAAIATCIELAL